MQVRLAKKLIERPCFYDSFSKWGSGFIPVNFLFKCERLKDFASRLAKAIFNAMIGAVECYMLREDFLNILLCLVANGACVNFGKTSAALTTVAK